MEDLFLNSMNYAAVPITAIMLIVPMILLMGCVAVINLVKVTSQVAVIAAAAVYLAEHQHTVYTLLGSI